MATQLAEVLQTVVGEGIVVVDHQRSLYHITLIYKQTRVRTAIITTSLWPHWQWISRNERRKSSPNQRQEGNTASRWLRNRAHGVADETWGALGAG